MTTKINLAGDWLYRLDPPDTGKKDKWETKPFKDERMKLPGTTASNEIGVKLDETMKDTISKESVESLREKYSYCGVLWLQKTFEKPAHWDQDKAVIFFERILGTSEVWVNNVYLGEKAALSTPHVYKINKREVLSPSSWTITVRVDNRNHFHLGELASGYSSHTQTIWSGIVGELTLSDTTLGEDDVLVYFDKKTREIETSVVKKDIDLNELEFTVLNHQLIPVETVNETITIDKNTIIHKVRLSAEIKWNASDPHFYVVEIRHKEDKVRRNVGILDLEVKGRQIYLDNKILFLRGTLDCSIFPKTGYPPTDEKDWEKLFLKNKEYGINHIRYHSWCPPEAAFKVADRLGMYLMIEGPIWLDTWLDNCVGDYPEHYTFIREECIRIVETYAHHPSFCFFAVGNELHGDFAFLAKCLNEEVFTKQQILTTITSNTTNLLRDFYEGADDFFVGVEYEKNGLRGNRFLDDMMNHTHLDYDTSAKSVPKPIITHEIGQYVSYPSIEEISKFKGPIEPTNLMAIKNDLIDKDLIGNAEEYTYLSGLLAAELYKGEIEAVVRSNDITGYQLLGLQDYPGQNTATVGILDSHWEDKSFSSSSYFRQFCNDVVPIVELSKRIYKQDEQCTYKVGIRNNLDRTSVMDVRVSLIKEEKTLFSETYKSEMKQGVYSIISEGYWDFSQLSLDKSSKIRVLIEVQSEENKYSNEWDIWVFTDHKTKASTDGLVVDNWVSPKLKKALEKGEKCLLILDPRKSDNVRPGNYFPVFWSPVWFESEDACGAVIDTKHKLFNYFPTDQHLTLHWKTLFENSVTLNVNHLKSIITTIPNFYNNERRSNLFEAKILNGDLLVCGFDIERATDIAEKNFKEALITYMKSSDFHPTDQLDLEELEHLIVPVQETENDLRDDLAYKKEAWADNEVSQRKGAQKGNDGKLFTHWSTASQTDGHWWCVDLGKRCKVSELNVKPLNYNDMSFSVLISSDSETWEKIHTSEIFQETHFIQIKNEARYIKLAFEHPLNTPAGLISCQVYEESVD